MLDVTSEVTTMTDEPPQLGPLSAMVKALLDEPGITLRSLAAATLDEETGKEVLNKDFWARVAGGVQPKLTATQIRWMAVAMRRPVGVIQAAASKEYFDFEPAHLSGYDDDMRRIVIQAGAMDPEGRRKVRAWLESLAEDGTPN